MSLLDLLSASDSGSSNGGLGNALMSIAAATNGAESYQKYQTGQLGLLQAQAEQKALQDANAKGLNPQQAYGRVAMSNPSALANYVKTSTANPLGFALGGAGGGNDQKAPLANLSGDDLLKALPPQMASTVKAYGEYKVPFNPRLAATTQGQQLLGLITQTYPDYNVNNSTKIAQTIKDYAPGGKTRQNINSIGTAINTLTQLQEANEKLGGAQYGNTIRNAALNQQSDPNLVTYNQLSKTAADEVTKAVIGSGGGVTDRGTREAAFTANQSPEARKASITTAINELSSRLDPLAAAYTNGRDNPISNGIELLDPKVQANYKKIMGMAPDNSTAPSTPQAPSMPQRIATQADIEQTAKNPLNKGKTIDQIKKDLVAKGYKIQ